MALQTITKDILTRTSGVALLELPYDICFIAGFDKDMAGEDVAARVYGEMVMASQPMVSKIALAYCREVFPISPRLASAITIARPSI